MDVLKLFESLNNIELTESKADQQMFIDKYGQEAFDRYNRIKDKIKGEWISSQTGQLFINPKDIVQLAQQGDPEVIDELISYYETQKSSSEKRKLAKEGAKLVFHNEDTGEKIYHITTPEAMQLYGENTTWCISGRYRGHEDEQLKWWNSYLPRTDGGYYVLISPNGDKYCFLYNSETGVLDSVWNAYNSYGGNSDVTRDVYSDNFPCSEEVKEFFGIAPMDPQQIRERIMKQCLDYIQHNPLVADIPFNNLKYLSYYDFFDKFLSLLKILIFGGDANTVYNKITKRFSGVGKQLSKAYGKLPVSDREVVERCRENNDEEPLQKLLAVIFSECLGNQFNLSNINSMLPLCAEIDTSKNILSFSCSADRYYSFIEDRVDLTIDYARNIDETSDHYISFDYEVDFLCSHRYGDFPTDLSGIIHDGRKALVAEIAIGDGTNRLQLDTLKAIYKFIINYIQTEDGSAQLGTYLYHMQSNPNWINNRLASRDDLDSVEYDED